MIFRPARREDVPAIVALLADDILGAGRESPDPAPYLAAFERLAADPRSHLIVGETEGAVAACYQLHLLPGLSQGGLMRAQIEAVRVAAALRGRGFGALLMADAEARARAGGAVVMQLTSNTARGDAHRFYARLGYGASHVGFKKSL